MRKGKVMKYPQYDLGREQKSSALQVCGRFFGNERQEACRPSESVRARRNGNQGARR